MKRYYKLLHRHKLNGHIEKKYIGIYSSLESVEYAKCILMNKDGFVEHQDGFYIRKVMRLLSPKLLDKTFWIDGFDTYTY